MNFKKLIPAFVITGLLLAGGIFFFNRTNIVPPGEVIQATLATQQEINKERPEDRVYAQLDKPHYAPGETIWFSCFVRNGADLTPSRQSEIVRAELINPKGEVEMEYKVPVSESGIAKGDFRLAKDLPGGKYTFRCYTLWQNNDANPAIFTKEIQVQKVVLPNLKMNLDYEQEAYNIGDKVNAELKLADNANKALGNHPFSYIIKSEGKKLFSYSGTTDADGTANLQFTLPKNLDTNDALLNVALDYRGNRESIARNVPILSTDLDIQFFPEGGDMIKGQSTTVAFKATDKYGKPVDVEGVILDKSGNEVADFSSLNKGMGSFDLNPNGSSLTAKVTFPSNIKEEFDLPRTQTSGYTLQLEETKKNGLNFIVQSSNKAEVSVLASVRGKNYFSTGLKVKKGKNRLVIPTDEMPMGVAQVTLFDETGIARAERLTFVNAEQKLNIEVSPNKEKYLPREQVDVNVKVTDERGNPVQTDLSMAVVDDQLLSFADDKSSNLLSWMLLEADVDLDIDEPNFYFDNNEIDAAVAMENVLMTVGWRRFDWEAMANNDLPKMENRAEKMVIAGTVLGDNGEPLTKAKVQILDISKPVPTANDGYFAIDDVDLLKENTITVAISAPGHFRQEQVIGDYGMFEYQLHSREKGTGLTINERADRATQAQQLGLADNVIRRSAPKRPVSSIFTQSQMQVVNFRQRFNDENKADASNYTPSDFEEGISYEINDNRIRGEAEKEEVGEYMSDVAFYRVREFPVKKYKSTSISKRTDFRSTAFWDGHIQTDEAGTAKVTFWNTDAVTSFNISVEGMSENGQVGRAEKKFYTQLPFSISTKIPVEVVVGDEFTVPVTLTNNSKKKVKGQLEFTHPSNLEPVNNPGGNITLKAGKSKTIKMKYRVKADAMQGDLGEFAVEFKSKLFKDKIEENITVVPRGFPTRIAYSGTGKETKYDVKIQDLEENTLDVELQAYPNALAEIVEGMDGMMKKPYGCFEQTSSCNYPNILALQYMRETNQTNASVERQARELLDFGYKRLRGFESPNGGFEWFGGPVGHEGISAFAVMQFTHMKDVYKDVDQAMIDRTIAWMNGRKDGEGGWLRNERTTWSLGIRGNGEAAFNAFIVYCLSEGKVEGLEKELKKVYEQASKSDDPYVIGMAALAHHNYGKNRKAKELTGRADQLVASGSMIVSSDRTTVFGGVGQNYDVEAKSLLILNLVRQKSKNLDRIKQLAKDIRESRQWNASFGPTHTTVLAMRALIDYSKVARETQEDGTIAFYVEGKRVAARDYKAGVSETIKMPGLEKFFGEGKYDFEVKFENVKYPMPHTVIFQWNTIRPVSSKDRPIAINTEIPEKDIKVGDQVRMNVNLENISRRNQPTPMAIVGIPAGLSPQAKQLNELVEKEIVDYYEISGSNIILYFRYLKKNATKEIPLDLKADFAGSFQAPSSTAYAYYNDQDKHWIGGTEVNIK